jgi:thioredoxin-like negative regulator of GroEL
MNKPSPTTVKFWALAALILLASAAGLAALWPHLIQAAHDQSAKLVREGMQASGGEAEADFQLATWLNPGNHEAYIGLARTQILGGQAEDAIASLAQAGEGSEVEQLKVRTLLELGRNNEAANEATKLSAPGRSQDDLMLAVLAYAAAGRTADESTTARLSSPEALQRVQRANAGALTLAAELYASGLLRSSSALLTRLPTSYERNLLLARINYDRHTKTDLAAAGNLLTGAIALNPASIEARQLLANVYRDQNRLTDAQKQDAFIAKLRNGQP